MALGEGVAVPLPAPRGGEGDVADDLAGVLRTMTVTPPWGERAAGFVEERRAFGMRKYGQPLRAFDGRSAHLDALQELVDLMAYLHKAEIERAALEEELEKVRVVLAGELRRTLQAQAQRDAERGRAERLEAELEESRRALVACNLGRGVHKSVGGVDNGGAA